MPKSVALVKAKEYNDFLACIDNNIYTMSDFERFAFVCENISLMHGSILRKVFLEALKSDTGIEIPPSALKNREIQKLEESINKLISLEEILGVDLTIQIQALEEELNNLIKGY